MESADDIPVRHTFRWDMDKTYLRTDFDTWRDLVRTALQKPEEKLNVPGADALLSELVRERDGQRSVVTFISGSPEQMRRTLEQKLTIDGIKPDAFILKDQLRYLIRGKFRAIRGQVGYKLEALLRIRQMTPLAPETLFGDDAEQDAFIYSLYADLVSEALNLSDLDAILRAAEVYPDTRELILERAGEAEKMENVSRVFIHLDRRSAPGRFLVYGPRVVPIINYFQAALILLRDEVLDAVGLFRVVADMMTDDDYGLTELANSFQDLSRRGFVTGELVERLMQAREDLHIVEGLPPEFPDRMLARLRALAPRPAAPRRAWEGPPDYLSILASDKELHEQIKESRPRPRGLFS
ncbi:MAG: phosphatase domain-containing protein [Myxococcota bacterium]